MFWMGVGGGALALRGGHRLLLQKVPRGICLPGATQEGKQTPEQDLLEQPQTWRNCSVRGNKQGEKSPTWP